MAEISMSFGPAGNAAALGAAEWLGLAAAPTFALMALVAGLGGGRSDLLCSAGQGVLPLNGMVEMYLLMSAFHLPPWLKRVAGWRRLGRQTRCVPRQA